MLEFIDTIYEVKGNFHSRKIVRAILLDKDNNIVLEQVERDDDFGYSYYVETPGGGINKEENEIEALKREVQEELGYEIEVISYLECVKDYYNLINRENYNYYYLARIIGTCNSNKEELEKQILIGETHLPIDESIELMKKNIGGVGKLVSQRELPILELVKLILKGE